MDLDADLGGGALGRSVRRGLRSPALAPRRLVLRRLEAYEVAAARARFGGRPAAPVAVVVPTFCRPDGVQRAVASVLAQTHDELIVLVIDGGGGLPALPDDPRLLSHTLSRPCCAPGVLRNIGVRSSASRWIAFLDDSLTWRPDHLERALERLRRGAELTCSELDVPTGTVQSSTLVLARRRSVRFRRDPSGAAGADAGAQLLVERLSRRLHVVRLAVPTVLSGAGGEPGR
jgi:hypothetical protein